MMEELKTNETYAWVISNFTDEEINKIKNLNIKKEEALVDNQLLDYGIRNSRVSWIDNNSENNWVYLKINNIINYVNYNYFRFDLTNIEPLQITEYDSLYNGFYAKHIDFGYNRNMNRKLSFVMFLNDPCEYTGGELLLYNSDEPLRPEAKKGNIIFFPSYVLHEVKPVISGKRQTLVGWINGPRFK